MTRSWKVGILVAGLLLALGNGAALVRIEHDRARDRLVSYQECEARNAQSIRSRKFLAEITNVGDRAERKLWTHWNREVPAGTIYCRKP